MKYEELKVKNAYFRPLALPNKKKKGQITPKTYFRMLVIGKNDLKKEILASVWPEAGAPPMAPQWFKMASYARWKTEKPAK